MLYKLSKEDKIQRIVKTPLAALKLHAANPKKDLNTLNSYAKKMRVSNVLRQYLEVLL